MTDSGMRSVDYVGGWSNRVDVAARRALMTGFNQVVAKVNEDNAEQLGTEYFEVSYHRGARPTHQVWQGRVYSKKELETVCGLGTVTGLCGANCYHSYSPFIKGIDTPTYSEEELDRMNEEENTPKEYNGKEYTAYEAQQRQRQLETAMRADRQKIELLTQGGADYDTITGAKVRYFQRQDEYVKFSKAMGLPEQWERVTVNGKNALGSKLPKKAESVNRITAENVAKSGESESSKRNIIKNTVVNKQAIQSSTYRKTIDKLSEDEKISRTIYQQICEMLKHRSGSLYEDLSFIDSSTGKYKTRTDFNVEQKCLPSKKMISMMRDAEPNTIIGVHNHPKSSAPSAADIDTALQKHYKYGVVACHNGDIYKYTVTGKFSRVTVDSLLDTVTDLIYNRHKIANYDELLDRTLNQLKENNIELEVFLWE